MKRFLAFLQSIATILPQVFQVFLGKRETTRFPATPAEITRGYRGMVRIRECRCVGCGLCTRDCPANALELNRISKGVFQLFHYAERCAFCGQCELSCRFDAIYLDNFYLKASGTKDTYKTKLVDRKALQDEMPVEKKQKD